TGVYYLIFGGIGFGLNNGLQALISRRAGENKPKEIGTIFQQGIFISLCIGAFSILFTYFVAPFIFRASIQSEQIYRDVNSFLQIRMWGLPFLFIYQMRNALLVGINRSGLLIIGTAAEAFANIFFDYTLIFGQFGMPRLGFNGAAYASVIAEFTGMFAIFLVIKVNGIGREFSLFKGFAFNRLITLRILQLSGPLIFQMAISVISWFFFYVLVEHQGQTSLAISNTMRNVFGFFGVFNWAFASAANTMVSNIIGQGKKEEVFHLIKKIMFLSMSVALFFSILLNLFPSLYFAAFGQGRQFAEEGTPVLRIVASALFISGGAAVWLNAVTGTGKSKITFLIELAAIVLYCAYVYVVLAVKRLPITWGWSSELIYWSIMLLLSFLYIRSGRWKKAAAI
ncbi:MAG: MATE family efflux transporter, partial [Bacteroidota bacterium]|nr:MATE family efflux transporter [Bacteroidota bacterium]